MTNLSLCESVRRASTQCLLAARAGRDAGNGGSEPFLAGAARARKTEMTKVDVIGWFSSVVLLCTLGHQVRKQWLSGDSRGVSTWLFVGQTAASLGFSVYSLLLENWVFLTTNLLLLINAGLGQWVTLRNRRHSGVPGV